MTSTSSVLAAFAIILLDLFGRAGLDKVLALSGGPVMVALWAQLQSALELVSAVALAGVLQGLTVMTAQARNSRDEHSLLRATLKLGLGTSLIAAMIVALAASVLADSLTQGKLAPELFWLAALAGCITVIPATLSAYWLGKHQQQRMLRLSVLTSTVLLLVAAGAWYGLSLRGLMWVQCLVLAIIGIAVWRYLSRLSGHTLTGSGEAKQDDAEYLHKLAKFVPVGLAIGIMSPVAMLLVRGMLSASLSWDDVGYLQALWRSAEWVTATAAGVLSLVFLPRLSSAYDGSVGSPARFNKEILQAGVMVLVPAACLLLLIWFNQRAMLATLYDARFAVSNETAALFMLGSWIRIGSWVFLFGLFAAHRTRLLVAGEVLSLPLYALLLWLFASGMTLERAALLYLVSYLVYLGFNIIALLYSLRKAALARSERA